jgi:hypothetical protein
MILHIPTPGRIVNRMVEYTVNRRVEYAKPRPGAARLGVLFVAR